MGRKKRGKAVQKMREKQLMYQEELYSRAPHSFVFNRGHVGKNVKQLISDMKRVMEPYTASSLKTRKKNVLKDFVSIAGVLNISHFMIFTKTEVATHLKLSRLPKGPTLTFKVHEYCLSRDVISSLKRPNLEEKQFQFHPLLVMNNFGGQEMHFKLMSSMFQNLFPSINVNKVDLNSIRRCVMLNYIEETKMIEFRHYNIRIVPVGMSKGVKKLIKANVPDMSKYRDISEYIAQGGNLSESDAELDGPDNKVVLPQEIKSRGNIKAATSAIRLTELGPRMTLQLIKVEEGLCEGNVLFHEFIHKTDNELQNLKAIREKKRKLKEIRKRKQQENVKKKEEAKEAHKQKSLDGMKRKQTSEEAESEQKEKDDDDDEEYFKQEVGEAPDPGLFPAKGTKRGLQRDKSTSPSRSKKLKTDKTKINKIPRDSSDMKKPHKAKTFKEKKLNENLKKTGKKFTKSRSDIKAGKQKRNTKKAIARKSKGQFEREKKAKHKRK